MGLGEVGERGTCAKAAERSPALGFADGWKYEFCKAANVSKGLVVLLLPSQHAAGAPLEPT